MCPNAIRTLIVTIERRVTLLNIDSRVLPLEGVSKSYHITEDLAELCDSAVGRKEQVIQGVPATKEDERKYLVE